MKQQSFLYSTGYLAIASGVTLIIWMTGLESIGIPIFLVFLFLLFLLSRDIMPAIPLLMNALFMVSQTEWSMELIPLYIYLVPVALVGGIVAHIIRFRVNIFKGKMTMGIGIMFLAMLLSTINAEHVDINYLFYALIGLTYAFVYFYFVNSLEGNHTDYLIRMMVILGFLIVSQVLVYYLRVDDVILALEHKTITLGWGISNYVATYLIMFIPMAFYYARKQKINFPWILLIVIEIMALFFTLSRGGIVAFLATLPFLIVYLFKTNTWKSSLISFIGVIAVIGLIIIIFKDLFLAIFDRFAVLLLDDTGRIEIYIDAWETFKEKPLFGAGIFARVDEFGNFRMFHNTILHVMACFGLVGLVGLVIQVIMMFRIILTRINEKTVILGIAVLGAHIHGMVDNVYLMPQFMILFFLIIAVMENANKQIANDSILLRAEGAS
ncbi:MAG: O-antigen ligase family protein [Candidatus Izemoplasmatales bacterium]|jgi:O-antigen ligase|nr:O-antigen ligase family protein [Candidatus Izemoplasmatales bacterium]MDY0372622.1 O-antigen ligase family protein [Candidatus Izemoplasmatales bacterium]